MGRVSRDVCVSTFAGDDHNRWLAVNAVDYGSDPLDILIRYEEKGAVIPLTGPRPWPYPGQDRNLEHPIDPKFPHVDPSLPPPKPIIGPCENCHGNRNKRRHCLVCNPPTPGVQRLPKDPPKKYVGNAGGMRGGIGA